MKVEWIRGVETTTPLSKLIKTLKKTETVDAVDPELGGGYHGKREQAQDPAAPKLAEQAAKDESAAGAAAPVGAPPHGINVVA